MKKGEGGGGEREDAESGIDEGEVSNLNFLSLERLSETSRVLGYGPCLCPRPLRFHPSSFNHHSYSLRQEKKNSADLLVRSFSFSPLGRPLLHLLLLPSPSRQLSLARFGSSRQPILPSPPQLSLEPYDSLDLAFAYFQDVDQETRTLL